MEKLLYLFAAIVITTSAAAQLQNLDFENWDYSVTFADPAMNLPTGWTCTNRWYGFEEAQFHNQMIRPVDSISQNKKYALSLSTFYNYMKDAAVQTASINTRPTALKGFYKYEENFIIWGSNTYIDTAQVNVWLTKWDATGSKNDTIGFGRFSANDSVDVFTPFQVDITYYSSAQPDSITVYLDPSLIGRYPDSEIQNEAHGGRSIFTIDNLSLVNGTMSVNDMDTEQILTIYPNPTSDRINFESISGTVLIFNSSGKKVMKLELNNEQSINTQHLKQGTYFLQIHDKNNRILYSKFIKK